jgi:hypothetical protein
MYCVYITFYKGNKLPPFYIGYVKTEKIQNGYRGSVSSKKYKDIWNLELENNFCLFSTKILKKFKTKEQAQLFEAHIQRLLKVHKNSLYINMSINGEKFYNTEVSDDTKKKLRIAAKKQFEDENIRLYHKKRCLETNAHHVGKIWITDGINNKRIYPNELHRFSDKWRKGRTLGEIKFWKHGNRKRDPLTGRYY